MSSSRCDILTQFFRPFVRLHPFFSFSVPRVLSSPKEVQWCFKKVVSVFEVSRVFQGCFKEVSRVFKKNFQGSLKGVSRKLQEYLKEYSG